MADKITRIAIVDDNRCKPKRCAQECKKVRAALPPSPPPPNLVRKRVVLIQPPFTKKVMPRRKNGSVLSSRGLLLRAIC
jgi:translation initiation factor RLI1